MHPHRITILGMGLLGGSIGLACRSRLKDCEVMGYSHRIETREAALALGAADRISPRACDAVRDADLIILCTPVSTIAPLMAEIASSIEAGALVTDVGSTKASIVEAGERFCADIAHFIGSHPMAGSERRGVEHARPDLFNGALCLLTPTANTSPSALDRVEAFWKLLGMHCLLLSPAEHDRRLAEVSHLPHALAAALMLTAETKSLSLAGRGFKDLTRIAGGDGALWRDILLDNRIHVHEAILRLRKSLDDLDSLLHEGNGEKLREWLDRAAARRREMTDPSNDP